MNPLGKWKPYPEYKDSGVEWLGEVPAHWDVRRLKYSAELNPTLSAVRQLSRDADISFVPMEAIGEYGGLDLSTTKVLADVGTGYTGFADGDVVVAKITPCFENGKGAFASGLVTGVAFGTTELHVLRAREAVEDRYLFYATLTGAFRRLGEAEMYGAGGQKRVPAAFIANLKHPVPPEPEQRAIAAFLDRETARIDVLVAKKEYLMALLEERRTALITCAVAKGIKQITPSLQSGSEAFPSLPANWKMRKLRRLITHVKRPVEVDPDADYREIGIRSWGKGIFHKEPVKGLLLEGKNVFRIVPGDLVLNIVFAWEGAVALASEAEQGMIGSHRFPTFLVSGEVDSDDLLMVLQTHHGRWLMEINSPGAAGRNRTIRLDQFLNEAIPLPPLPVQRELVQKQRAEEQRLQALASRLREGVMVLREFRLALTSAAVTGRIDVRGEVA